MRVISGGWLGLAVLLAACSAKPSAEQRAATDLNPSGRPYAGPPGVLASTPPADTNFNRLYCHPEGQGTSCARNQ